VTVSGVVLDKNGNPAPGSMVEAIPIHQGGFAGNLDWTATDKRGGFKLTLGEGRYQIRAKNEPGGYPDPNFLLAADPRALFPEVEVFRREISGLEVRLGSRGAVLEGDLREAQTSHPIPKAKISICDFEQPKACVELSANEEGHFRSTVPSKPLLVSAEAPGYEKTALEGGAKVTLAAGEHRHVEFDLKRQ
jgi:hypothetical protein